jgi:two-component system LytT family response regulator
LFVAVELPDSSGFDFVKMLRRTSLATPEVIFVSSCERHAMSALDASAAGYLLKPIDETKLEAALAVAKDRACSKATFQATNVSIESSGPVHGSRIIVKSQGRMVFVPADTIDWVQANRNYLTLHVGRDEYRIRESIQSFERRLRPFPFLRIHRSTIVNVNRIREVERWYTGEYIVRLISGKELTLSKTYRDQFFAATTPPAC